MIATSGQDCPIHKQGAGAIGCWVTLLLLLSLPMVVRANVYRCPAVGGVVQFQQTPCANGQAVELQDNATQWKISPESKTTKSKGNVRKRAKRQTQLARDAAKQEKACWKAQQRIEKIEWSLRKGYKPARGERLRQQRREQQTYIREFCR